MAGRRTTQIARLGVFALAVVLFAFAVQTAPMTLARMPLQLGSAIVGVSAAVAPNGDNMLAAQLAEKEAELNAREAALDGRGSGSNDMLARYSFMASIGLFGLLALNYFLDWRRAARTPRVRAS